MQLAGKWFLMPEPGGTALEWQGQFLTDADTGFATVQLYSWLTGCKSCEKVVSEQQILAANIYSTHAEFLTAADALH